MKETREQKIARLRIAEAEAHKWPSVWMNGLVTDPYGRQAFMMRYRLSRIKEALRRLEISDKCDVGMEPFEETLANAENAFYAQVFEPVTTDTAKGTE